MPVEVAGAGVDTWSPAWRVDAESSAGRLLGSLAVEKSKRGYLIPVADLLVRGGDGALAPLPGYRVGWNSGASMLWAEGHPLDGGLCSPDALPAAFASLVGDLLAAGVPVPGGLSRDEFYVGGLGDLDDYRGRRHDGFVGVRRVDSTVDLRFDSPGEGLAALAGVGAVVAHGAGHAQLRYGVDGGLETIYLHGRGGRTILGRWYDKGLEAGSAPRGTLIRPEDQRRYVKETRRDVPELTSRYVRDQFQRRFVSLYKASKGVKVTGPIGIADRLAGMIEAKEITARKAEQLAGYAVMRAASRGRVRSLPQDEFGRVDLEQDSGYASRTTDWRRRADLTNYGLVLADGVLDEVEVDLESVLERCLDSAAWGAVG